MQRAQRKKITRQVAWRPEELASGVFRPESDKSVDVKNYFASSSSESESESEDDNQSLQSYGPLKPGLKCCPETSSCRDCYCHWSRSGRRRAKTLTKIYIGSCYVRLLIELVFFKLQLMFFYHPVPDVYDCMMKDVLRKCFVSRATEKTFFRKFSFASAIFMITLVSFECLQLTLCCRIPFIKTGSRVSGHNFTVFLHLT